MTKQRFDVKDLILAEQGSSCITWALQEMPVVQGLMDRFEREQPLQNIRISGCLHITAETANLARVLKAAGADLVLCACNPLSTQDDVAAALISHLVINGFCLTYRHCGQTCVAPDYVLVHEKIVDSFIQHLKAAVAEFHGAGPKASTDYPRIVNEPHFERLT